MSIQVFLIIIARSAHVVGVGKVRTCPSVRSSVRPEVIENLRAAFGGWTHRIPYAAFDHLILKKILKIQK